MIPAWRIVKRVPHGSFNVIIAVGKNGGWAFDEQRQQLGADRLAAQRIEPFNLDQGRVPWPGQRERRRGRGQFIR